MGIVFDIRESERLVHVSCTGDITLSEILAYEQEVIEAPGFDPSYDELIDLRGATKLDVSFEDVEGIVSYEKSHEKYVGARKCAFVAPRAFNFGIARMYELMEDDSPMETKVFRDIGEARSWLGLAEER